MSRSPLTATRGALDAVAERLGLRSVIRFGSRAARALPPPTPESDLDLAVVATPLVGRLAPDAP